MLDKQFISNSILKATDLVLQISTHFLFKFIDLFAFFKIHLVYCSISSAHQRSHFLFCVFQNSSYQRF